MIPKIKFLLATGFVAIVTVHCYAVDTNALLTWTNAPVEAAIILTPKPGPAPHINGPKVYGCRAGHPFLYRIPVTGERPIRFAADDLPDGLILNRDTGIITGAIEKRGEFNVTLRTMNRYGPAWRNLKIVCG